MVRVSPSIRIRVRIRVRVWGLEKCPKKNVLRSSLTAVYLKLAHDLTIRDSCSTPVTPDIKHKS